MADILWFTRVRRLEEHPCSKVGRSVSSSISTSGLTKPQILSTLCLKRLLPLLGWVYIEVARAVCLTTAWTYLNWIG